MHFAGTVNSVSFILVQLILTEGTGGIPHTCSYNWRTDDDGIYMMEIGCDGYVTRKQTFTLESAKGE